MAKTVVMALGIVFILVGLIGFFNDPVLSVFDVNVLHNIVHLASGILAAAFAMKGEGPARGFAKVFGFVYLAVAILGWFTPELMGDLLHVNGADNWLHILLALVFLGVGYISPKTTMTSA